MSEKRIRYGELGPDEIVDKRSEDPWGEKKQPRASLVSLMSGLCEENIDGFKKEAGRGTHSGPRRRLPSLSSEVDEPGDIFGGYRLAP